MTWDLHDFRLVTASAYPGMMAPLTAHPSAVCVLSGDTDGDLAASGTAAQSLEALDGVRRRWRFGDVSRLADFVPKVLARTAPDARPILLVPPRSSIAWEAAARAWPQDVRLIGRPADAVNRIAEDKAFVRERLRRIGLPVPHSVLAAPDSDFATLAAELGIPFVLQSLNGAGGQGTFLVRSAGQLAEAVRSQPHLDRWLASAYAGDITINVAGIVHFDGVEIMPASLQCSAIGQLGAGFGSYCGSDFGAVRELPDEVLAAAYRDTAEVGRWLHAGGHRGMFGADIAVSGSEIAFLEVNPRVQGSSWLLSRLQLRQGGESALEQHVQAVLDRPAPVDHRDGGARPSLIETGSHLLVRWTGPAGVVHSAPASGSYPVGPDAPAVTVTGLPAAGTMIMPGAIMARLESAGRLTDLPGTTLRPEIGGFVSTLRGAIDTAPVSTMEFAGR